VLAGLFATVGILAALRHRDRTGVGQRVDVTLLGALLSAMVNQGAAFTVAGVVPGRMGNAHPSIAPYELFETGAGQLVIAVGNDRQFEALCQVLGAPELASAECFATNRERVANRVELRAALEARLASHAAGYWSERLVAARVPAGVVNDLAAAFELATRLGHEPIVDVPREDRAQVRLTRNAISLSETPAEYRDAPPRLPNPQDQPPPAWAPGPASSSTAPSN
jgi:crotonobetainyl-CoA:carnitine CoA-transferase CaiB-like acyl-CoA transferase